MDTISWASPTTPLPMTRDPRLAFEELFGTGGSAADRANRNKINRSILDSITHDMSRLQRNLDRERSQPAERLSREHPRDRAADSEDRGYNLAHGPERELPAAPIGVPDSWEEHVKLMFDLQVLAFAADVTRVSTFKLSRDTSNRVFAESGCRRRCTRRRTTASARKRSRIRRKINRYHLTMLAYFADKLKNTPDGDGNLLDHSLVLYGSPMGDGNVHGHRRVPMVLLGTRQRSTEGQPACEHARMKRRKPTFC